MYSLQKTTEGAAWADVALLLFRVGLVVALGFFQLAPEAPKGWEAIWNQKPWPLAKVAAGFGVPQAQWVLAAAMVLGCLALLGIATGFLTRLSSALLLAGAIAFGYGAVKDTDVEGLELSIVYSLSLLYLLLRGPGYLSADGYFSRNR